MKIAYLMSRFPLLSETFILREMDEFEAKGGEIALFPMICQNPDLQHEEAKQWNSRRNCVPFFNLEVLGYFFYSLLTQPKKVTTLLIQVIACNLSSPKFLVRAVSLFPKAVLTAKKVREAKVDHIHAHYATHPALIAFIISSLENISYSITIHSHDIYDNHAMLRQKLDRAKFLVTVSSYNVQYLGNLLGEEVREKTHVIHCGVNPDDFQPSARSEHRVDNRFEMLQIGSLHWKKGQTYLLKAVALLRDSFPDFRLTIIGEGKERDRLEALISALSLEDHVILAGAKTQSEIRTLLPQADCYIQSSVSEGIPVAIMEALSCQLPVIATNITGIPELVLHKKTGLLVPPRKPDEIAQAILYLIHNPQEAAGLGKAGREFVTKEFSIDKNVQRLVALFHAHLGSGGF